MRNRASVYGRQSSGKAKSISEQLAAGRLAIRDETWEHVGDYSDGTAASRFGRNNRSDWERLIGDLKADAFDILILWESSRGDRTLSSWAAFLELCRKHHVRIHVIADDHTYDLERPRDWKTLATAGVDAAAETDLLSIRVKRGHAGAAADGKPAGGPTPYGYRRSYDPQTGKRRAQVIHEPEAVIVREIFERVAAGETILGLVADLNERKVSRSRDSPWLRCTVREIIRNPAYIGRRAHNGVEHAGDWEPIVTEALYYAAGEIVTHPSRRTTRPGSQKHLLSYLGRCGVCDAWLNQVANCYRCVKSGCVSIPKDVTDRVVTEAVLGRLSQPNAEAVLAVDDDEEAEQARVEAGRLRAQLDEWRRSAVRGETSPASLAMIERELTGLVAAADAKSRTVAVPAVLRGMLDPAVDVRQRWENMTVIARRALIKSLCEIRVTQGRPGRRGLSVDVVEATFARLGQSRWLGDERTWSGI